MFTNDGQQGKNAAVDANQRAIVALDSKHEITLCREDGTEYVLGMNVCQKRQRNSSKCLTQTFSLVAKVPHVDCEPVTLELKAKTLTLGDDEYEVELFGGECGKCSTLYVIQLKRSVIKCAEPIQICSCQLVGEVGCNQVQTLIKAVEVQGSPCPTIARETTVNDARYHRKNYRIYMSKAHAEATCEVEGTIIAKTSKGSIRITGESFEGECPSVSGYLDLKDYPEAIDG